MSSNELYLNYLFLGVRFYLPKWLILSIFTILVGGSFNYSNELFEYSKNLEIFSSVYRTVQEDYVEEVPPSKMAQTAIKKMLESLDPYTVFLVSIKPKKP